MTACPECCLTHRGFCAAALRCGVVSGAATVVASVTHWERARARARRAAVFLCRPHSTSSHACRRGWVLADMGPAAQWGLVEIRDVQTALVGRLPGALGCEWAAHLWAARVAVSPRHPSRLCRSTTCSGGAGGCGDAAGSCASRCGYAASARARAARQVSATAGSLKSCGAVLRGVRRLAARGALCVRILRRRWRQWRLQTHLVALLLCPGQ